MEKRKWHVVLSKQTGLPSWLSGTDINYVKRQRMTYVEYKYSHTVQYLSCYDASILGLLTIYAYIIMTMHVFSMNITSGDNLG